MKTKRLTITRFFDDLGAPLKNQQWSWGAIREDGAAFLRVWDDEVRGGMATVESPAHFDGRPGGVERLMQIEKVRAGAPCYLVVLTPTDSRKRTIASFNRHELLVGGEVVERDGLVLVTIAGTTAPMAVRKR